MPIPQSQLALQRVLDYLRLSGLEITSEVQQQALSLVSAALQSGSDDLLAECMQRLPGVFTLPRAEALLQAPAIHRGSLFYGAY